MSVVVITTFTSIYDWSVNHWLLFFILVNFSSPYCIVDWLGEWIEDDVRIYNLIDADLEWSFFNWEIQRIGPHSSMTCQQLVVDPRSAANQSTHPGDCRYYLLSNNAAFWQAHTCRHSIFLFDSCVCLRSGVVFLILAVVVAQHVVHVVH